MLGPTERPEVARPGQRMAQASAQPANRTRHLAPAVGQQGPQQAERVLALTVADHLDVRVVVEVGAAGDRHALGVVDRTAVSDGADDRLAVGAQLVAERGRQVRQVALITAAHQQRQGAEHARRAHDLTRAHGLPGAEQARPGAQGRSQHDFVAVRAAPIGAADATYGDGFALGLDACAAFFREIQVVLVQRILGVVLAAGHARAAADAALAVGAYTAEVGIGRGFARSAEEHADVGDLHAIAAAHFLGHFTQHLISRPQHRIRHGPEHALGGAVVRRQLGLPVAHARPLRIDEERPGRHQQRVGVHQAAAAHAAAGQGENVVQQ